MFQSQHQYTGCNQAQPDPFLCRRVLIQKHHCHQCHQNQTEFINRRHLRSIAQLQSLEIRQPRKAGSQTGQYQEKPISRRKAATITNVRINVAKSESIPCKPALAKIAVNAAKRAEANAQ